MNLRKDNNGKALKAWKKMGPASILKPLRFILRRAGPGYYFYKMASKVRFHRGDWVNQIARDVLLTNPKWIED